MINVAFYNFVKLSHCNLVEAHCYGIGRTGHILEQSCSRNRLNVKHFDHEGLHQLRCCFVTDEDLRGRNVLHSICV